MKYKNSWLNKLTSLVLHYTHSLWKHRCTILQAEQIGTMDMYHRDIAERLHHELLVSPDRLDFRHRHLLQQRSSFFSLAPINSVHMWHRKILNAMDYRRKKNVSLGSDIRNWILCRPYDPGRSLRGSRVPKCSRLFKLRTTP